MTKHDVQLAVCKKLLEILKSVHISKDGSEHRINFGDSLGSLDYLVSIRRLGIPLVRRSEFNVRGKERIGTPTDVRVVAVDDIRTRQLYCPRAALAINQDAGGINMSSKWFGEIRITDRRLLAVLSKYVDSANFTDWMSVVAAGRSMWEMT